jgi:hypothetical protein
VSTLGSYELVDECSWGCSHGMGGGWVMSNSGIIERNNLELLSI